MEPSKIEKTRIKNRWPIAREGIPFILTSAGATLFFFYIGLTVLPTLLGIICLFIIYFFRDPPRRADEQSSAVLAPADGRILNIQHIHDDNNPFGAPAIKISIFMSVFNVHVNRVPVSGKILEIE